jgi:glutathione synthase/RimK-type ligase-like ATP-grasp enzyme
MMDSLRLTFGVIDMIQTPGGEYVFLEVNPSGQWLWLDDILECGISDAVAEWLAGVAA